MQSNFEYSISSYFQQLRIRLRRAEPYESTKTPLAEVITGVTISFSGTEPCAPVEINCFDVADLSANEFARAQFARLCGPSLHAFLEANHYYFTYDNSFTILYDDVRAWQLIWLQLQDEIVGAQNPTQPVEASNVVSIFNRP